MMEPAEITETLMRLFGEGPPEVIVAYLYGSVARGDSGPRSDVDVAVLLTETPRTLDELPLGLEADLERLLGRRVQVVVLNTAPVDLIHRVLRDSILLVDRNTSRRIAFEVQARNEFFDLQPYLREYRRQTGGKRDGRAAG
jgi:predicted nucleotidyltransferase